MKTIAGILMAMAAAFCCGCSSQTAPPAPQPQRELTASEVAVVKSQHEFGLDLFGAIIANEPDTNCIISPLSVSMALGMTYNAADGETQKAMEQVLAVQGLSPLEINEAYRGLIDLLVNLDPKVTMDIANSIWYRDGLPVKSAFQDMCAKYFDASIRGLDFNNQGSVDIINGWVNERTRGKIPSIVEVIKPSDVMFLINAIYFKGDWTYQFEPDATAQGPFHLPDGETVDCDFMNQHVSLDYYQNDLFTIVDLPYGDEQFSMTIFLPHESLTTGDIVSVLTDANWSKLLDSLSDTELDLLLPKFEQEYNLRLNDALIAMGMEIAFDPNRADLSGLCDQGQFFIDEVLHKTYVKVDEVGTEAAAVTSVVVGTTAFPTNPVVVVNRPFLFVIRDNHSDAIIFVGKIVRPTD